MATMKYSNLVAPKSEKNSIRYWINHAEIDAEGVLLDAQAYIYGAMRTREMKAASNFAMTASSELVTLSTVAPRFLDPIQLLYRDGAGTIGLVDESTIEILKPYNYDATIPTGRPFSYAILGDNLTFEFRADIAYPVRFQFYQRPLWLDVDNQTNWVTERYPNILRAACLMGANDIRQETIEYQKWKARTDELIVRANAENELERRGSVFGTPQWQRPYYE